MADHADVVEARGWPQPPHMARRSYIRTRAIIQLALGAMVAIVGTGLLVGFVVRGDLGWSMFAFAFILVGIAVMLANLRTLARLPLIPADRRVPITLPYAFAVDGDQVVFPAFLSTPEERWPLRETYAVAGRTLDTVTLVCPGHRPRRFFAISIRMPTIEAANLVNERREARYGPDEPSP